MATKKILITGGAGFIGYFLAKHLLQDPNNKILLTDNLQRGRMDEDLTKILEENKDRISFTNLDLTDPQSFAGLDKDFDHAYHLAAINGTKNFYEMPHETLRINTLTLTNILDWITKLEKKPKLCFTSSNEAYAGALESFGQLPIPTPEKVPLVISDTYNPRWTYAATKLIGELFVIHYAERYGFPAVIVRPHNFYGPRAGYDHVIPEFCQRIQAKTDPFPIYGADDTRTFCYITDAVRAMQLLMDSTATDKHPIETVHIGDFEEIDMQSLAQRLFKVVGWAPSKVDIHPSPAGSVKRRLADISKLQALTGWKPEVSLDQGLKETYNWYAAHPKAK